MPEIKDLLVAAQSCKTTQSVLINQLQSSSCNFEELLSCLLRTLQLHTWHL